MREFVGFVAVLLALQLAYSAHGFSLQPRTASLHQSHFKLNHEHKHKISGLKAQQEDYFLPLALKPYPLHLWVRRCGQLG